ncbi:hypothetical protein HHL22_07655 [Hymenobacter sp. RP-2-7]|uniref:Lipocalin-like domain-containing protein n=1 Tax=Hymenobacter polaris TaxID=2682546 RepID=A0A7Y0AD13_9BACT|nr:hypothetical protein [Hymenobacter polaris]NML65079.1 hypothetical protein [Hymenobacter polaris]
MKILAPSLVLALALGACHREAVPPATTAEADVAAGTSVVGTWRLVALQCFCPATNTVPNQRLLLDSARHFQYLVNDKLAAAGTYALGTGSACSAAASAEPLLQVAPATPNAYAPHGNYTLRGDTLIIDQCLAADGPRYTFRRQR